MNRLLETGLMLNTVKCLLSQPELEWYSDVFSAEVLRVHSRHIDALPYLTLPYLWGGVQ